MDTEGQQAKEISPGATKPKQSTWNVESLTFTMSHDLQEPIRTLCVLAEYLHARLEHHLNEETEKFFQQVIQLSKRLRLMVHDMVEFSRFQSQSHPFESLDLNRVVQDCIANLSVACKEAHATIICDPLPNVRGDAIQLLSLFQNLIGNAIKFRQDPIPPEIRVGIRSSSDTEYVFFVRDNGIGIDPKYFDKLFTLFRRLHPQTKYPGTGIGLATCKEIVQHHGGRIWVESAIDKGSTFLFSIPR